MFDSSGLLTDVERKYLWDKWCYACDDMSLADDSNSLIQAGRWHRVMMQGYTRQDVAFFNDAWILCSIKALAEVSTKANLGPNDRTSIAVALWFSRFSFDSKLTTKQNNYNAALSFMEFFSTNPPDRAQTAKDSYKARVMRCLTGRESALNVNEANYCYRMFLDCSLAWLATSHLSYAGWTRRLRVHQNHLDDTTWMQDRRSKLQVLLDRENIFHTFASRALFETEARRNISREISDLNELLELQAHTGITS